jgi:hypothetical protein
LIDILVKRVMPLSVSIVDGCATLSFKGKSLFLPQDYIGKFQIYLSEFWITFVIITNYKAYKETIDNLIKE